ncbi:cupin domain-containing protein [Sphingomonas sp.]|uniref:cupin domain-containing protein n=1 Tax=Sphingomonas sp. TaxID=28214 RepID=UPI0038A07B25
MNEREIVCEDLSLAIDDLRREGFRIDVIYPADDPATAVLSKDGEAVRVSLPAAPPMPETLPPFVPEFVVTRAGAAAGQGRAGMLYRDLIPGRLGGRTIASHITIQQAGPVADWVHYHRVLVQLIYVRRGWVRVVYEDQGEPFVMEPGDLVLQPPLIRHRVLESSAGLEVVEISAPALHETFADHELELPNAEQPQRMFGAQRFLRHVAAETAWTPFNGGEAQETIIAQATGQLAEARTIRPAGASEMSFEAHDGELVFGFVLEGRAALDHHQLGPADAFVIPPDHQWRLTGMTSDFRLLHVTTACLDAAA